ncbi:MAG: Ppx/GppA family phosphatase [Bacteroidetes bacterium]|nr:Ppx/GppA family phosphatase [Bacteroidota bacterium]
MTIASIDIGTNTILMLIAELASGGGLRVISDQQVVARVGKGVDHSGSIAWDAFTRSETFLATFLEEARSAGVDVIRCTGTSALRDAKNGDDYLDYMHAKLGLEIEILSGDKEALWTYGGAISGFIDRNASYAVLDIGGGSTEMTVGHGFHIDKRLSLDIGCVRLTEKFLQHTPPTDAEIATMMEVIDAAIPRYPAFDPAATTLVGVAGTVTTLAAVEQGLKVYEPERIAGYVLTRETIARRFEQFRTMSKEQLQQQLSIDPGRADIILVGVAILKRLTELRNIPQLVVSERGLRYGIAMREWERHLEDT